MLNRKKIISQYRGLVRDPNTANPLAWLAQEYGTKSMTRIREILRRAGEDIPKFNIASYEREHRIAEIEFLRDAKVPYETIAKQLDMPFKRFLETTDKWYDRGQMGFRPSREWHVALGVDVAPEDEQFHLGPNHRRMADHKRFFRNDEGGRRVA